MKNTALTPHNSLHSRTGPVLLAIMDGIGFNSTTIGNAVHAADTPFIDNLLNLPVSTLLKAHGKAVGMPTDDDMDNSEVGHNALGAGRIFDQGASLVKHAIASHSLYEGKTWKACLKNCIDHQSTLHFIGLLSDGNVHSHIDHLISMLTQASKAGVSRCRIHCLLDGRDVFERSALTYITQLENHLNVLKISYGVDYKIASGGGRMLITMDRYNADWEMVEQGWKTHVLGKGRFFSSATNAVQTLYNEHPTISDQVLPSFVISEDNQAIGQIMDHDSVIFFNFRGDRAIELSLAFEDPAFDKFDRQRYPQVFYAGMMEYDGDRHIPQQFLVKPPLIDQPLSHYLCAANVPSFAISETQKYGHVTYFWNGNKSGYVDPSLETYIEIPSDKNNFDKAPQMKATEITEKTIDLCRSGNYRFGRINFPNGDMVGHTGNFEATVKACEATDRCLQQLANMTKELNGILVVLSDHGNADMMFTQQNGQKVVHTAHTLNPVPFGIYDPLYQNEYTLSPLETPGLANVASTLCHLLGFQPPDNYEPSLISFQ